MIELEIPLLRGGKEYFTSKRATPNALNHFQISYSQAPEIIINQSLKDTNTKGYHYISEITIDNFLEIIIEASDIFTSTQSLGISTEISLEETQQFITATTGMPIIFVRNSFIPFSQSMKNIREILEILSPNNSVSIYDTHIVQKGYLMYGWIRRGKNLAVVAPSNHPGVNTVWAIMAAMKFPTLVRPSIREGLFAYRYIQALYKAGLPKEALHYLPMNHKFIASFLMNSDLGIIFGDETTTRRYANKTKIKTYGPGRSKIILDTNYVKQYDSSDICDMIIGSTLFDGGKSCINASSLLVVGKNAETVAEDIAFEIAVELANIIPQDIFSEKAKLAAFVDNNLAKKINRFIESNKGRDIDLVEKVRETSRLQVLNDVYYLLPSVFLCENGKNSRLFGLELPFPFLTINTIEDYEQSYDYIKRSLVISLLSESANYARKILELPHVEKLYLQELTCGINPAEPHEGFPSEFLFRSKAYRPKPGIDKKSFAKLYADLLTKLSDKKPSKIALLPSKREDLYTKFKKVIESSS